MMDNDFLIELRDALKSVEDSEYPVLARAYYRRKIIAISTGCPVCCSIHGRGSSCPVGLAIAMIEKELAERPSVK
jgi:hypothetical protein